MGQRALASGQVRLWLLLAFSLLAYDNVCAQDDATLGDTVITAPRFVARDSAALVVKSFDQEALEKLRADDDLNYKVPPTVAENLWQRFWAWLGWLLESILRGAVETDWGRVLLYLLGIALLIAIVMMVLKVDAIKVFYAGSDRGTGSVTGFDKIHEMDFEKLLLDALQEKEFRAAVRLTFLHALKMLSDRNHVEWRPGKTNHDYVEELTAAKLKTGFNELSFYFDYAWYGHFAVTEPLYRRVQLIFNDWKKNL